MGKVILNIEAIRDDILSPGKIIWQKKSGSEVVISAKHSFLNLVMIEKLLNDGHSVFIEDDFETHEHQDFVDQYHKMENCLQVKDKLIHRNKFINLLQRNYISSQRSQDDLNQLAWKLFSQMDREEAKNYLNRDINFFKRGMSVAGSYAICAFLLGYYDNQFLNSLYTKTFKNLMTIGSGQIVNPLKEQLENMRNKSHFNDQDRSFVKAIIDLENPAQVLLMEKFDGSGIMGFENQDFNELEMIVCSLNYFFHWDKEYEGANILSDIKDGRFNINLKIINLIKDNLEIAAKEIVVAA